VNAKKVLQFTLLALNEVLVPAEFYLYPRALKSTCIIQKSPATLLPCNLAAVIGLSFPDPIPRFSIVF